MSVGGASPMIALNTDTYSWGWNCTWATISRWPPWPSALPPGHHLRSMGALVGVQPGEEAGKLQQHGDAAAVGVCAM